jgi:hypothetical protein
MPKVCYPLMLTVEVFCQISIEKFFAQVQLNMSPETKTDYETKKHLSVSHLQLLQEITLHF